MFVSGILRSCPCPISHSKNCCLYSLRIPMAFSEAWKYAWLENPGHLWPPYQCCSLLPFAAFSWMPTVKIHKSCMVMHCLFCLVSEGVWTGLAMSECILWVFHWSFILGLHHSMWLWLLDFHLLLTVNFLKKLIQQFLSTKWFLHF